MYEVRMYSYVRVWYVIICVLFDFCNVWIVDLDGARISGYEKISSVCDTLKLMDMQHRLRRVFAGVQ